MCLHLAYILAHYTQMSPSRQAVTTTTGQLALATHVAYLAVTTLIFPCDEHQ